MNAKPTFWVTSDTHFTHTNVIDFCDRPYRRVGDMNRDLVNRWNALVGHDDIVIHLGDFAFDRREKSAIRRIFSKLNGRKWLVQGNHDDAAVTRQKWEQVHPDALDMEYKGVRFHMSHKPPTAPDRSGSVIYLHGHLHTYEASMPVYDVGVDAHNYYPLALDDLVEEARQYQQAVSKLAAMAEAR